MPEPKITQRVYEKLYTDIACAKYHYEEDLPSITSLCELFSVGRNTMRSVLKKLEDDHFIKQEKGRNASVIFDNNQPEYYRIFQETIYGRLPAMIEIFQVMECIMPEIVEESLRHANEENIEQIKYRIQLLRSKSMTSSYDLMDALMAIYLYVFSLMDNDHVVHLFTEMMEFVTIIAPKDSIRKSELNRMIRFLGQMMSTIMDFVLHHDAKMMKKAVRIMARSSSKQIQRYVNHNLDEQIVFHPIPFHWDYKPDYLYQRIVIDILNDINQGKYNQDKILPTFEQLAEQYHVSVRTSRKAIDILNSYQAVKTINGVGSFVCVDDSNKKEVCRNKEVLCHIKDFCEVLQLLQVCMRGLGPYFMKTWNREEIEDVISEMHAGSLPNLKPLMQLLFIQNSSLVTIYQEAIKDFPWNVYIQTVFPYQKEDYDFRIVFKELETNLRNRKFTRANQLVDEIMYQTYHHINQAYQNMLDHAN